MSYVARFLNSCKAVHSHITRGQCDWHSRDPHLLMSLSPSPTAQRKVVRIPVDARLLQQMTPEQLSAELKRAGVLEKYREKSLAVQQKEPLPVVSSVEVRNSSAQQQRHASPSPSPRAPSPSGGRAAHPDLWPLVLRKYQNGMRSPSRPQQHLSPSPARNGVSPKPMRSPLRNPPTPQTQDKHKSALSPSFSPSRRPQPRPFIPAAVSPSLSPAGGHDRPGNKLYPAGRPPPSYASPATVSDRKKSSSPSRDAFPRSSFNEVMYADFVERLPAGVQFVYRRQPNWTIKICQEFVDFCSRWPNWRSNQYSFGGLLVVFFEKRHGLVDIWAQTGLDFAFNVAVQRTQLLEIETFAKFLDESYSMEDFRVYIDSRLTLFGELTHKSPVNLKTLNRDECKSVVRVICSSVLGDVSQFPKLWSFIRSWFANGNSSIEQSRFLAFVVHFHHALDLSILPSGSVSSPDGSGHGYHGQYHNHSGHHSGYSHSSHYTSDVSSSSSHPDDRLMQRLAAMQQLNKQIEQEKALQAHAAKAQNSSPSAAEVSVIEPVQDRSMHSHEPSRPADNDMLGDSALNLSGPKDSLFFELEQCLMAYPSCVRLSEERPSFFTELVSRLAEQAVTYLRVLTSAADIALSHPRLAKVKSILLQRISAVLDELLQQSSQQLAKQMPISASDLTQLFEKHEEDPLIVQFSTVEAAFNRFARALIGTAPVRHDVEPACAFAICTILSGDDSKDGAGLSMEDVNDIDASFQQKLSELELLEPLGDHVPESADGRNAHGDSSPHDDNNEAHRAAASELY